MAEQAAYHEAGHAVAYCILGRRVVKAAIEEPEQSDRYADYGGFVHSPVRAPTDRSPRTQRLMLVEVIGSMAGRAADRVNHGGLGRMSYSDTSGMRWALELFVKKRLGLNINLMCSFDRECSREYRRWQKLLERRTAHLLDQCWPMVEAVARALVAEHTLSGAQVRRLVTEATPPRLDLRALRAATTAPEDTP
jgi:hypothetical protein